MGMDMTFRSLTSWPGKPTPYGSRRRSQFSTTWSKTVDLLERELGHLRAKNVVIEADCPPSEVRIDGQLRSNAKLRGPGVVLSFDSSKGPLRFPCDTFTDWQANVRGIALGLEALRAVDRYGVTQHAEQYKGWTALPDRSTEQRSAKQAAAEWLVQQSFTLGPGIAPTIAELLNNDESRKSLYRRLATAFHPDRCGDDRRFKQLEEHMVAFEA